MEERLIKVEVIVEVAETVMLWLAKGLAFIHLPIAVKVGPSLLIWQNLWERINETRKCGSSGIDAHVIQHMICFDVFWPTS